jgi:hypothetical protein
MCGLRESSASGCASAGEQLTARGVVGRVSQRGVSHVQIRDEDCFRGVDLTVKNFLVSVPLVADLRSPAMRERHWEQLMTTTKVRAAPPGTAARAVVCLHWRTVLGA